jgi:hypothetical protein
MRTRTPTSRGVAGSLLCRGGFQTADLLPWEGGGAMPQERTSSVKRRLTVTGLDFRPRPFTRARGHLSRVTSRWAPCSSGDAAAPGCAAAPLLRPWSEALAEAEGPPIRFHDLRHTTASLLLQAGAPLHAVQRILRHRNPRMTANVYGHLSTDYLRAEIDRRRFNPESELPIGASRAGGRVLLMSPSRESGPRAREASPQRAASLHAFWSEEYGT